MRIVTRDSVRADLSVRYSARDANILFGGVVIGRLVSYGRGGSRGNVGSRTVYASRICLPGVSIELEGSKTRMVLDKVARDLAKAINSKTIVDPRTTQTTP